MAHSLVQVYVHLVFSTRYRLPLLAPKGLRLETHRYLAGMCNALGAPALEVGGVEDHVHIACRIAPTMAVADLLQRLKKESSRWIKGKGPSWENFAWQTGYGAFSLSPRHLEAVRRYIANQEAHHRRESLETELRRLRKGWPRPVPPSREPIRR